MPAEPPAAAAETPPAAPAGTAAHLASAIATETAAATAAGTKQQPRQLTQMYLDVGQRDFHSYRCPTCGMLYARGTDAGARPCSGGAAQPLLCGPIACCLVAWLAHWPAYAGRPPAAECINAWPGAWRGCSPAGSGRGCRHLSLTTICCTRACHTRMDADDRLHAAFHASATQGPRYQGWQGERVAQVDGSRGRVLLFSTSADQGRGHKVGGLPRKGPLQLAQLRRASARGLTTD